MQKNKTHAFTLVELLVVIAIIGVLVALLLPAVQAAREAARRMQCINNLKQIGLGLANYESSFQQFPIQYSVQDEAGIDGSGLSWMMSILPFIEQQALFDSIDPTGSMQAGQGMVRLENYPAIRTPIDAYLCPSDPEAKEKIFEDVWGAVGIPFATLSYVGVIGPHDIGNGSIFGGLPDCHNFSQYGLKECSGTFWRHTHLAPVKLKSFTDGLSNTTIVGEVLFEFSSFKYWALSNGTFASTHAPLNFTAAPGDPPEISDPWLGWRNNTGFRSRHPGGAHFLWGDGHIAFFSEAIDEVVYRGLSTRAGEEIVAYE